MSAARQVPWVGCDAVARQGLGHEVVRQLPATVVLQDQGAGHAGQEAPQHHQAAVVKLHVLLQVEGEGVKVGPGHGVDTECLS